jgi:hypothetical protein
MREIIVANMKDAISNHRRAQIKLVCEKENEEDIIFRCGPTLPQTRISSQLIGDGWHEHLNQCLVDSTERGCSDGKRCSDHSQLHHS